MRTFLCAYFSFFLSPGLKFPSADLKGALSKEATAKEAASVALAAEAREHDELKRAVVETCQQLEGEGTTSGSSLTSRVRALEGRIAEYSANAFRLGMWRALGVATSHYNVNFDMVSRGYAVPAGSTEEEQAQIAAEADAKAEDAAFELAQKFGGDVPPFVEFGAPDAPAGGDE